MVFNETEYDELLKLYDDVKFFKINNSYPILENFHSKILPKFKLKENENESNKSSRQNLSATMVCACALSEYFSIWDNNPRRDYASRFIVNGKKLESKDYYKYIADILKKELRADIEDTNELELIDEFSLLNTLSMLKNFREFVSEDDYIDDYIGVLCKKYLGSESLSKEVRLANEKRHPFFYYKFLCILNDWLPKDNEGKAYFEKAFNVIYESGKHELYRQMSFYRANDRTQFDVKRLIYGLLIVTTKNRYSNIPVRDEAIRIIFQEQYETGLFSMGQSVKPIFVMKSGEASSGDRIISGNPILSSIECLNDMLGHEYVSQYIGDYQKNLMAAYKWIFKSLRKEDTTSRLLGWFPEHGDEYVPKSWVAGHYLIYMKNYCDFLSSFIEKQTAKDLNVIQSKNIDARPWNELGESYDNKKFLEYMVRMKDEYSSALLYGPPGTGKSTITRSLAKKMNWNYVEIVPGMFLSEGEANIIPNINSIFKRLMRLKKTIIFFDEVDQLVEKRTNSSASSRWIVTSLLPKFQDLRNKKDIKFIMATNNVDNVDEAMIRGGRIDLVLPMGALSWKSRLIMLRNVCKENNLAIDDDFKALAEDELNGIMNGRDLISDHVLDEIDKADVNGTYIMNYLRETNYVLLPNLIGILKIFKKPDWKDNSLFMIFFEGSGSFNDHVYLEYEKFHVSDPMKYIRLPPDIKAKTDVKRIYRDNIFN